MFITYTHPDDLRDRHKKWLVNSHASRFRKFDLKKPKRSEGQNQHTNFRQSENTINETSGANKIGREASSRAGSDTTRSLSKSSSPIALGGLRKDPFASFPMAESEPMHWAVDYYTQVFARGNDSLYKTENGSNWLLSWYFPKALQDEMLFESVYIFTFRQFRSRHRAEIPLATEHDLLARRSNVIGKLHRRLSSPEKRTDDITLHTVLSLMASDFHAGNDDHVELHREGLRTIIALRGGLESEKFDHFSRFSIKGTEMLCDFAIQRRGTKPKPNITPQIKVTYPRHPFSPDLCDWVSGLPKGFEDLALKNKLCIQLIRLLYGYASAKTQRSPLLSHIQDITSGKETVVIGVEMLRLVNQSNISSLEKIICIFCLIVGQWASDHADPTSMQSLKFYAQFRGSLQGRIQSIARSLTYVEGTNADFAIWGSAVILTMPATPDSNTEQNQLRLFKDLFAVFPVAQKWKEIEKSLEKFSFPKPLVELYKPLWEAAPKE